MHKKPKEIKRNKTMKILMLSHISDLVGGAERSMIDIVTAWDKVYDIEPVFILRKPLGSLADELKRKGWKYHELEYTFWSDTKPATRPEDIFHRAMQNSKAILDIEEIIQKMQPDVVMTNSIVAPWAALAAYFQQIPHIWFVREYGDLDHGRTFELGRQKTFEDVSSLSDLVVANSKTLAEHIGRYVDKSKITMVYTPFDFANIDKRATEKVKNPYKSKSSLKLVITGSLTPSKGQLDAVKAVALLNDKNIDTELCIIGGAGPSNYRRQINKEIKKHGLKNKIHLVGHQNNPLAYVALSDVGIMASKKEAFGRVTFEYIAAGKPVVGANSGGTQEIVVDEECGYLYEPGNPSDLAKKLDNYVKNSSLIHTHGVAARKHAERMLKSEFNATALFKRISKIIADNARTINKPIHFTHRILEYQNIAANKTLSVKRLAYVRIRQRAKKPYLKLKSINKRISKR